MNERKFGYRIKQQLDHALDLEPGTLKRLKAAREQALARQRMTKPAFALAWADTVFGRVPLIPASVTIALAGAALVLVLVSTQYSQQKPSVEEVEEIDAAILTSDLPINAYLDKSFDTWLKRSQS